LGKLVVHEEVSLDKGGQLKKPGTTASRNVIWHSHTVTREQREKRNGHRGAVVWLTGPPASGKSTIAHAVEEKLHDLEFQTAVLDGDNIRHGLCADLGFSIAERNENVRRTGEVAKLLLDLGVVVLAALVSPIRSTRAQTRQLIPAGDFLEIYCRCPLPICKARDRKGLYVQAESGAIPEYTGVSSPYEAPLDPALILDTGSESIEECVNRVMRFLLDKLKGGSDRYGNTSRASFQLPLVHFESVTSERESLGGTEL
jgi:adenylylsulfate kinase